MTDQPPPRHPPREPGPYDRGGGQFPYPPAPIYQLPRQPTNGVATAGGVCGIVGAAISWIPLINIATLALSIVAVALGGIGLARATRYARDGHGPIGRGMAITGIVIGAVGLALALMFIAAIGHAFNDLTTPTATT